VADQTANEAEDSMVWAFVGGMALGAALAYYAVVWVIRRSWTC
jgi:hypothetical protein